MTARRRHAPACRHCPRVRLLGIEFQSWRATWDAALESAAYGYATEGAEFRRDNPAPTFRAYLIAMTGSGWPMSGRAPSPRSQTAA